jgi:anti-sigma factor RsiW
MNAHLDCDHAAPLLDQLAAATLAQETAADVRQHVAICPSCRRQLQELAATRALLRASAGIELPAGFAGELHRKLVAAGPPPLVGSARWLGWLRARPFTLAAAAAGASALLAILGTAAVLRPSVNQRIDPPSRSASGTADASPGEAHFEVPEQKVALVKIDFASAKDIDDVSFEVLLPDGLRFFSGGQELAARSFQWHGKLSTGSNVVPVAVKGSRPGRYRVIAHAVAPGLDVSQDVVLEVTS